MTTKDRACNVRSPREKEGRLLGSALRGLFFNLPDHAPPLMLVPSVNFKKVLVSLPCQVKYHIAQH
jgi:hypothetical protein